MNKKEFEQLKREARAELEEAQKSGLVSLADTKSLHNENTLSGEDVLAMLQETELELIYELTENNIIIPYPFRNWADYFDNYQNYVTELSRWTPLRIANAQDKSNPYPSIEDDVSKRHSKRGKHWSGQQEQTDFDDWSGVSQRIFNWQNRPPEPITNPTIKAPEGHSGVEHIIS